VDDHLREHAFVAELVLFDRLVLPKPPENDTDEYAKWMAFGWRPDDLRETVKTLEEFAVSVPWDYQLRSNWETQYRSLSAAERAQFRINQARGAHSDFQLIRGQGPDQPAKWVTRGVLRDALDPAKDETLYRKLRAILDIDPTADIVNVEEAPVFDSCFIDSQRCRRSPVYETNFINAAGMRVQASRGTRWRSIIFCEIPSTAALDALTNNVLRENRKR
jgi:hypothetical protein